MPLVLSLASDAWRGEHAAQIIMSSGSKIGVSIRSLRTDTFGRTRFRSGMLGNGDAETTERQAEARTVSHRSEIIDRPQDHEGQFSPRTTVQGRWALDCAHPFGKGSE